MARIGLLFVLLFMLSVDVAHGQCSMCLRYSNLRKDNKQPKGLTMEFYISWPFLHPCRIGRLANFSANEKARMSVTFHHLLVIN